MVEESVGGVTHSLDSGIHYTLFHHTFDLLDRERKNSAKISPLEGIADVMFKRGTGFIFKLEPHMILNIRPYADEN